MFKRIFFVLCVVVFVASAKSNSAFADSSGTTTEGFDWSESESKITIESYHGDATDVIIPDEINGFPVTTINYNAFENSEKLISITIPSTVTRIEDTFTNCTSLKKITVNDNNMVYSSDAYGVLFNVDKTVLLHYPSKSGTLNYSIPNTVDRIEDNSFYGSGIESVSIPQSVTSIGDNAFYMSGLKSVSIPGSVNQIGPNAFYYCDKLASVTLDEGIKSTGINMFADCGNLTSVNLPNTLYKIAPYTFKGNSALKEINIPQNVKKIDIGAFWLCESLESIDIPNGVTYLGVSAFGNCTKLSKINIPSSLQKIEDNLFNYCESLTTVTIPLGVNSIGNYSFMNCKALKEISIPNSVLNIGNNAFEECTSLFSISIPNGVNRIEDNAFEGCTGLESIEIPNSVTSIGDSVFALCSDLLVIHSSKNSVAEDYAKNNNIMFQLFVNEIKWKALPTKSKYLQGQPINLTGGTITVIYTDLSSKEIDITPDMISGYQPDEVGTQTVKVTYQKYSLTFNVTVVDQEITSIKLKSKPKITNYVEGDNINLTGAVLLVEHYDGYEEEIVITSDMISGYNPNVIGTQTITVYHAEKSTSFQVSVIALTEVGISIKKMPNKINYTYGEELNLTGALITVTYNNGAKKDIAITNEMVNGYNSILIGNQSLLVTYQGKSLSLQITISKINQSELKTDKLPTYIYNGKSFYIGAYGGNGSGRISYKSSNTAIATVDASGKVTVKGYGSFNIIITKNGDDKYNTKTLSVQFNADRYLIKFDKNGGSGTMKEQTLLRNKNQNLNATLFTKSGYTFVGWATTPKGKVIYKNNQSVQNLSPNITLYAVWYRNPAVASHIVATSKKNQVAISWGKVSGQYYQVEMSTDSKFAKKSTVKGYTKDLSKVTVSKLKSKITYYFRVRTYKVVNGVKIYSNYVTVKCKVK